jgi:hypothetical protein
MGGAQRDYGRGPDRDRGSGGRGSNAPYIITEEGHHSEIQKPRTLLQALSDIQQYYVMEAKGRVIPGDLFTIQARIDYLAVGLRSGFREGLLLFLLMSFVEFYLIPRMVTPDVTLRVMFHAIPFVQLLAYTIICCWIARYYTGVITKTAINYVLGGRIVTILIKAFVIWFLYNVLAVWGTPERAWAAIDSLGFAPSAAERLFYWFYEIRPRLAPVANRTAAILLVGGVLPYGMLVLSDQWKRHQIARNARLISGAKG